MDTTAYLAHLRNTIEKMEKIHQLFILDILVKNKVEITENGNGVFVNMSLLTKEVLSAIKEYAEYVEIQEQQLHKLELLKQRYQQEFYGKDNKAEALG